MIRFFVLLFSSCRALHAQGVKFNSSEIWRGIILKFLYFFICDPCSFSRQPRSRLIARNVINATISQLKIVFYDSLSLCLASTFMRLSCIILFTRFSFLLLYNEEFMVLGRAIFPKSDYEKRDNARENMRRTALERRATIKLLKRNVFLFVMATLWL